jgi:DNA-binding LytR/AlgR family response regulator
VWLITDLGRLRAATQGMHNLERELARFGFLRIHRSYIVNPGRICEVQRHGRGMLTVSTQTRKKEMIPVSRRCAVELRNRLRI